MKQIHIFFLLAGRVPTRRVRVDLADVGGEAPFLCPT